MSNIYRLVNPHIEGDFKGKLKANNSMLAARAFYKSLSQHFNNNIPKFYFTIQKGGSGKGKYYHFIVKESKEDEDVKFNIQPYSIPNDTESLSSFENKLSAFKSKFNQQGGKKPKQSKQSKKSTKKIDDSSDSELDSSDDFYARAQTYRPVVAPPLYYWWYDPQVYKLDSIFIPTFYSYVTPYLHIQLNN
jgi:hypothetical protein